MRKITRVLGCLGLAGLAAACGPKQETNDDDAQLVASESEAMSSTLDASESSGAAFAGFAPAGPVYFAGCAGQVNVLATAMACSQSYPSHVSVTWSCTGALGNGVVGTADVLTTITPDNCPASQWTVDQTVTFDRTRTLGAYQGHLSGTSDVTWQVAPGSGAAQKDVTLALSHEITRNGNLIRHQELTGSKTVSLNANGPGPADDERIANGQLDVQFVLAGVNMNGTETDLTWHRDCCYPVAGTIAWTKSGNATGSGSITFGPSCGDATRDDGSSLVLDACSD